MSKTREITVTVNGAVYRRAVEPRLLLADFLRGELGLTGTHVGCEHGVCGACTVMIESDSVRSCLMFAVQADGCRVETVEGLAAPGKMNALQAAFHEHHDAIREGLSGNLCRCTGYEHIVAAVRAVKAKVTPGP